MALPKIFKKTSSKVGLSPGALVHVGERKTETVTITVMDYDQTASQEKQVKTVEDIFPYKETPTVTWINVDGLHEVSIIEKIGEQFGIHPLIQEDILHTGQRPKMEDADSYVLVILKMLRYDGDADTVRTEQISIILGKHFVISFQEAPGDVFNPLRERIRNGKGRVRRMGADYLAYALIDSIVDHYFILLEKCGERIEALEEELRDIIRERERLIQQNETAYERYQRRLATLSSLVERAERVGVLRDVLVVPHQEHDLGRGWDGLRGHPRDRAPHAAVPQPGHAAAQ